MAALATYWHTLRHLRPVQFYRRAWFRLHRPLPDLSAAPMVRGMAGQWAAPVALPASMIGPERFCFLNAQHSLATMGGWDAPEVDKLWRYNLHYFQDLNAEGSFSRTGWHISLMERWRRDNPPGRGSGWEPYPTSLRIVNWIKWALGGHVLSNECLHSLAIQARWLTQRLEWHLLGNHLFANAKALVFAGLFLKGAEAEAWLRQGCDILCRELPEQILPDGGQFELSPMYHALALEDVLDLLNLLAAYPDVPGTDRLRRALRDVVQPMRRWLRAMSHPDGDIALFNDAAIGIAPSAAQLDDYAARLGFAALKSADDTLIHLADSGYICASRGRAVALIDAARIGPDYLPGHAHADTLSFELSLKGRRMIVNSGTSCYGAGAERLRQRGTAAHNCVIIDGENSSEVWSGFRVAQRARPCGLSISEDAERIQIACAHDGYLRLSGQPVHKRWWQLSAHELTVIDRIEGQFGRAEALFHFHPKLEVCAEDTANTGSILHPSGIKMRWIVEHGEGHVEQSSYHPAFGVSRASRRLVVRLGDARACVRFIWD